MFQDLLRPEVQQFIRDHEGDDARALTLKHKTILGVPTSSIAAQILARTKAKTKIPIYYNTPEIVFPPGINLEQSSSEQTAKFKTDVIQSGNVAVDLTGGFGVDSFFLSRFFTQFDYVEMNNDLVKIAKHNHQTLGANNIRHYNATSADYVRQMGEVDLVYVDPSRRAENKKVFGLLDSEPNIVDLQSQIFEKSKTLMVKAAPLLDVKLGMRQLRFVKHVYVISVDNEVKELLFLSERDYSDEPVIEAVNLGKNPDRYSFHFSTEESFEIQYCEAMRYLYEPFSAILKAGAFKSITKDFPVTKIHPNTHLYSSEALVQNFPGRIFEIQEHIKPEKKVISQFFPEGKANIITRNYPLSPVELKKKTGLIDGGEKFMIAFSSQKHKPVVAAVRIR